MHTLLRTVYALYCTRYAYSIRNSLTYCLHMLLLTRYAILYAINCTRYCTYLAHGIYHGLRILWRMACTRYTQSIAHGIRIGCSINRIFGTEVLKVIMYSYLIYCIFINKEADGERRPDRAVRAWAATWKYPTTRPEVSALSASLNTIRFKSFKWSFPENPLKKVTCG